MCVCTCSNALDNKKIVVFLQLHRVLARYAAHSVSQHLESVINTALQRQAVVNKTEFGVLKSKGQGLDFTTAKIITSNAMMQ